MNKRTSKKRASKKEAPAGITQQVSRKGSGGIVKQASEKTTPVVKMQEEELRVGDLDQYLFGQGTHYDIYKKLGAHKTKRNGRAGVYFAVWAPNAAAVNVIGVFNGWN